MTSRRNRTLYFPPAVPKQLQPLVETHTRLKAEEQQLAGWLRNLDDHRARARQADAEATRRLIDQGKQGVVTKATDDLARQAEENRIRQAALQTALKDTEQAILDTCRDNQDTWAKQAATAEEKALDAYLAAVRALADAREEWTQAKAYTRWVDRGPTQPYRTHDATPQVKDTKLDIFEWFIADAHNLPTIHTGTPPTLPEQQRARRILQNWRNTA